MHMTWESLIPELIFVTNITNYICEEKIVMWRNFGKFLEILEKFWEILGHFKKFWEILGDFSIIYVLSCGEKLSPKVHLWRKNDKYEAQGGTNRCSLAAGLRGNEERMRK